MTSGTRDIKAGKLAPFLHSKQRGPRSSTRLTAREAAFIITDAMNGQLNGFHDTLIDEGSFLFTSESVGEGHAGESVILKR